MILLINIVYEVLLYVGSSMKASFFNALYHISIGIIAFYFCYSNTHIFFPVERYKHVTPVIKIADFFNGKITGNGIVYRWNGTIKDRFEIDLQCLWKGGEPGAMSNKGSIEQHIVYSDNDLSTNVFPQSIQWKLLKVNDNEYYVYSNSILEKSSINHYGYVSFFKYVLLLNHRILSNLTIENEIFMINEHSAIVRTKIKKIGFVVATSITYLTK